VEGSGGSGIKGRHRQRKGRGGGLGRRETPTFAVAGLDEVLRQLGGLAGSRLPHNDEDLVFFHRFEEFLSVFEDRQGASDFLNRLGLPFRRRLLGGLHVRAIKNAHLLLSRSAGGGEGLAAQGRQSCSARERCSVLTAGQHTTSASVSVPPSVWALINVSVISSSITRS
jgi:hypothetical protein